MIRHILLIAFKPGTQPAQIDAVRNAFLAIPHQVSGVTAVEWGRRMTARRGEPRGLPTAC